MNVTKDGGAVKRPVLSVVMPFYNAEAFIVKALESLEAQTFGDWELVAVDDGSTDASAAIVRDFMKSDSRIRLFSMPSHTGAAYQPRKKAVIEARAAFVALFDADDLIAPDYLGCLVDRQKSTGADIVYPVMYHFDDDSNPRARRHHGILGEADGVFAGRDLVKYTLDLWRINCGGGLLRRQLFIDAFGRYGSSYDLVYADELLTRQMLLAAARVAFSDAEYYYRQNLSSVTHRKSLKQFDKLRNNVFLHEIVMANYSPDSEEVRRMNCQLFKFVFDAARHLNRCRFSRSEVKDAYAIMRSNIDLIDRRVLRPAVTAKYYYTLFCLKDNLTLFRLVLKYGDRLRSLFVKQLYL